MPTYMPTLFLAPTGAHTANATPWLESAPYHRDPRPNLLIHPGRRASLMQPAEASSLSHYAPSQAHRPTANSFQSPYFYRASGLAQIAVSALLRISSLDARKFSQRSTADTALEIYHSPRSS